jgi:HlyD family secretion protein/adhesin transport system membrane fusion protein
VTVFDALPLLAALQALFILGYLSARNRSNFGNEVAQMALFAGLAVALVGSPGSALWLGLSEGYARVTSLAWVIAAASSVLFVRMALRIPPEPRQGWPGLLFLPALVLSLISVATRGGCDGGSCTTWPRVEAAWNVAACGMCIWLVTQRFKPLYQSVVTRPRGRARAVAVVALLGTLGFHTLESLAYVVSPHFSSTYVSVFAAFGQVLTLQALAFSVIRLFPEGMEDALLDEMVSTQVSRVRRHLSQAVVFEEGGVGPLVRGSMLTTIMTVSALIAWAAITPVKEVAVTNGQVVPSSFIRPVQHLEGGIVNQVMVKEGQLVRQGDVLIKLDPAQALAELEQTRARETGLLLKAERLRAFAESRAPNFAAVRDELSDQGQTLDQGAIFEAQERARESAAQVLVKQIEQRRADIVLYNDQITAIEPQIQLLSAEIDIRKQLMERELIPKVIFFNTMREYERLKGERSRFQGQLRAAREALAEAENRLDDHRRKLSHDAFNEMGAVTAELAQLREARAKLEDRVMRLEVVSPVRGIVQELAVTSPGAVIQAGGMVAKIVPVDDSLLVESQITPRDIGNVTIGQPVRIKVASYDFARFGAVGGHLEQVSASTFLDEKKNPYYKGLVALDKPYVGDNPNRNHILPGMTVQVDVITGEKTILQYLLKPIYLAANQAFQER